MVLTMEHLTGTFALLFIGLLFSMLAFIAEVEKARNKEDNQKAARFKAIMKMKRRRRALKNLNKNIFIK